MRTPIPKDLSELQRQLNHERDRDSPILLSPAELWQAPFCMSDLFEVIPGCECGPLRLPFGTRAAPNLRPR
jgi:hypothetical protein